MDRLWEWPGPSHGPEGEWSEAAGSGSSGPGDGRQSSLYSPTGYQPPQQSCTLLGGSTLLSRPMVRWGGVQISSFRWSYLARWPGPLSVVCQSCLFFQARAPCPTGCSIRNFAFNTAERTSYPLTPCPASPLSLSNFLLEAAMLLQTTAPLSTHQALSANHHSHDL